MTMWLTGVLVVLAAVLLLGLNLPARFTRRHLPGPTPSWLVGNLPALLATSLQDAMHTFQRQYGDVFIMWVGMWPFVCVSDPDMVHEFSVKHFKTFMKRPYVRPISHSFKRTHVSQLMLINATGGLWSSLRAASQPLFHSQSLKTFHDAMQSAANHLCDELDRHCGTNTPFDIHNVLGHYTLRVIIVTAFGINDDSERGRAALKELTAAVHVIFEQAMQEDKYTALSMLMPLSWWPVAVAFAKLFPDQRIKRLQRAEDVIYGASYGLLRAARRAAGLPVGTIDKRVLGDGQLLFEDVVPIKGSIIELVSNAKHKDTGEPLTDDDVISQAYNFMIGGHETSANTLAFAVYYVTQHARVEAKMREELRRVLNGRCATFEDIEHLKYTEAVLKEAMRLQPTAIGAGRIAAHNTQLSFGNVPKDTMVFSSIYNMHRDPRFWSEPEQFKPERFLEGSGEPKNPRAFMPFGIGPRQCIGFKMAQQEAVLALSRLYSRYTFALSKDHEQIPLKLRVATTTAPKDGLWVVARRVPETDVA